MGHMIHLKKYISFHNLLSDIDDILLEFIDADTCQVYGNDNEIRLFSFKDVDVRKEAFFRLKEFNIDNYFLCNDVLYEIITFNTGIKESISNYIDSLPVKNIIHPRSLANMALNIKVLNNDEDIIIVDNIKCKYVILEGFISRFIQDKSIYNLYRTLIKCILDTKFKINCNYTTISYSVLSNSEYSEFI